ncbi:MAG: RsmB/NOP family class I SAM-dependent RNA methyltransferase [Verrucomicrobiota bacterium]
MPHTPARQRTRVPRKQVEETSPASPRHRGLAARRPKVQLSGGPYGDKDLLRIAESVIRKADREHPADAVLREELKSKRDLSRADGSRISRAVFAFYRWQGWLSDTKDAFTRVAKAVEFAERFAQDPACVSDKEIVARALPAWVNEVMDVTPAWARSLQAEPTLWLRAHRGTGEIVAKKLGATPFGPGALSDTLEYRGAQDLFRTPEFHAGEFELQDLSSQAVGWICRPQPGETWWDACAGEGGKLLHLSDLMQNKGLIWASDRAAWRLEKLKRRAGRAKVFNYRTAPWDGSPKPPTKTRFHGVLLDAPCSGVGTWQRNPHARWTTTAQDVAELGRLQQQLLAHASTAVKPGGKLIYSVCTLTRAETIEVANAFTQQFPEFEPLPINNPLEPAQPPSPTLWLWPQTHRCNGMFIAAWLRK